MDEQYQMLEQGSNRLQSLAAAEEACEISQLVVVYR